MPWNKICIIAVITTGLLIWSGPLSLPVSDLSTGPAWAEEEQAPEEAGEVDPETGEVNPCPECEECPDPAKVVLRGLDDRRQAIDQAQAKLDLERKELERYAEQVDEKLTALETLKKQINEDLARLEKTKSQKEQAEAAAYETKINRLVKMYAGMKPKNAALIVDQMELKVAEEIFLRMRESSASQILAFVNAEKAAKISERLAFKRN